MTWERHAQGKQPRGDDTKRGEKADSDERKTHTNTKTKTWERHAQGKQLRGDDTKREKGKKAKIQIHKYMNANTQIHSQG